MVKTVRGCRLPHYLRYRPYQSAFETLSDHLQKDGEIRHITQIGTGNYNEKTAKLYTDLSVMTANEKSARSQQKFSCSLFRAARGENEISFGGTEVSAE